MSVIPPKQLSEMNEKEFERFVEKEITNLAKLWMGDPVGAYAETFEKKTQVLTAYISYRKTREQMRWNRRLVYLTGVLALANVSLVLVSLFR